jgi:hypothetical protein
MQTLNQIEIKMVDKAAEKKVSEFMYQGMDHQETDIADPLEQAFSYNQTEVASDSATGTDKS